MKEEAKYLEKTIQAINEEMLDIEVDQKLQKKDIQKTKDIISSSFYEIDDEELSRYKVEIDAIERVLEVLERRKNILERQKERPYFARVDFLSNGKTENVYIGLSFVKGKDENLVYDWRAPISSVYYDYDVGPASYECSDGVVNGEITLKRQFNISNQKLNYFINTNETVNDEILQEVLSKNASPKMKEIVSTIQREQNKLIRCDETKNVIVQGVAGSGKTSVALHRAAYLLYKLKGKITSDEIFILSPSSLFSSYISDVLPELGESNVFETTFLNFAKNEIVDKISTREMLIEEIETEKKNDRIEEVAYKASFEFLDDLLEFLQTTFTNTFRAKELVFSASSEEEPAFVFTKEEMEKFYYETYKDLPISKRIDYMTDYLIERFNLKKKEFLPIKERFEKFLYKFFPVTDVKRVFDLFLSTKGFSANDSKVLRYDDVAGILIIQDFIFGLKTKMDEKYIIIDEMQDFTPAHFYIINKLWDCPKLLLGDINQCLEKKLSQNYLDRLAEYFNAEKIVLNKTYRSTKQIAKFCQKIIGLKDVVNMNRDGDDPKIIQTDDQVSEILKLIASDSERYKHIAVICKTIKEEKEFYEKLKKAIPIFKLTDSDNGYDYKVVITTPTASKGIEFDSVIIPNVEDENYNNELDKNLLYVSGTRALHKLSILYTNNLSRLIKF